MNTTVDDSPFDRNFLREEPPLVAADEIRWTLDPLPRLELRSVADLLALDPGDLLEYAADLQDDLKTVRLLLHESLGALTLVNTQRDRLQIRVRLLVDELRAARETLRALSADLRAYQERKA